MKPESPLSITGLTLPKAISTTGAKKLSRRAFRMVAEALFRVSAASLALFALFGFNPQTLAATYVKTATVGDLSVGGSWVGGTAPGSGDLALFNNTITAAQTDTIASAPLSLGEIQVANPGGAITINGPDGLTLNGINGVGIDDYSTATQNLTIAAPITLGSNQLWEVGTGRTLSISGGISGSNLGFTKTGPGTLSINTTASSFTGTFASDGGVLTILFPAAVTTNMLSASSTLNLGGGAVVVQQSATPITQTFASTNIGQGDSQIEFTRVSGGVITIKTGIVTRSPGGTVEFNGVINKNVNQLAETSNANGFIGGWAYTDSLQYASSNGAAANVTNSAETANAWGATTNTSVTANYTAPAGTTQSLWFGTAGAFTLTLTGADVIGSGGILMNTTPAGNVETITGGTSLTSGDGTDLIVGQFDATAGASLAINANIIDNAGTSIGLTKSGAGLLALGGNNTFTGPVYLNNGTINLTSATALGSGVNAISFGNSQTTSGVLALNGFNATVASLSTANVNSGLPVVEDNASGASTLTINNAGTSIYNGTVQNGAAGAMGVTMSGAGTQTLAGSNTYTGPTTVNSGTLVFTTSLPASTAFNVAGGGTLNTSAAGTLTLGSGVTLASTAPASTTATVVGAVNLTSGSIVTGAAGSTLQLTSLTSAANGSETFSITDPTPTTGSSSLINVTGSGGLTLNGGSIILSGGTFLSGNSYDLVYDLFQFNGALGGTGVGNLSVATSSQINGLTYAFATSGGYVTLTIAGNPLALSNWITDGGGSWANAANWSAGVPNGQSATANLGGSAPTFANLARTITLDGNETVGVLNFSAPDGESYTITQGTGGALILDNAGKSASISTSGTHVIDSTVSVELNSNLTVGSTASTDSLAIEGVISNNSGTDTLTKTGPGKLILTNANIYGPAAGSVGTIVNAGVIQFQNNNSFGAGNISFTGNATVQAGAAGLTLANNFIMGNGVAATVDANGNILNFSGVASDTSGNGILTVASSVNGGTVVLTGPNTYGGGTNINTGATLQIGNNTSTLALPASGAVADNGALVFDLSSPGKVVVGNVIGGTGSVTQSAAPIFLELTGTNSYSGGTVITSGTVQLGNSSSIGSGNVSLAGGALLDLNGVSPTVGALSGAGNITSSTAGTVTLTFGTATNTTYSGGIQNGSATVSVSKNGGGITTLSGSNTYTGATNVNAGTLTINGSLGTPSVYSGAITNLSSTLNINGPVYAASLTNNNNGGVTTTIGTGANVNISGALTANTNGLSGGLLAITGGTVTAGSAIIGRDGANYGQATEYAGSTADGIYVNGGTFNVTTTLNIGTGTATNSSAQMREDSGAVTVGGITDVTDYGNNRASLLDLNGGTFTGTGGIQIGGAGADPYAELLIRGTAIVSTSGITFGSTAQTGGQDLFLAIGGTTYIGSGGIAVSTLASGSAATTPINLGYTGVTTAPIIAASAPWSSSLPMTLVNSSTNVPVTFQTADSGGNAQNITLTGNLTGAGGLTKTGAGVLTLSGVNTFTGNIAINGGTLALGSTTPFGTGAISFAGGALQYSSANTIDYSAQFANSTGPIAIDTDGQKISFANAFASTNTGGLTVLDSAGTGSLTLNAVNTFTGTTTVGAGATLKLASGAAIASTTIINNGALNVAGAATLGSAGGAGLVLNGGSQFSLVDNATSTVTLPGNLTIGGATAAALDFELNNSSSDALVVNGSLSFGTGGGLIYLSGLTSTSAPLNGTTFNLISDANGIGTPNLTLETTTIIIDGSSYSLSLAPNVGDTADVLTLTALSSNLNYYFQGAHTPTGTWSDVANFTTDNTGANAQNMNLNSTSNVFLVADNASPANFQTETLDGTYTINSLSFTGTDAAVTNTPATTTGITLNAGTGGALTLTATNGFFDTNGNNYNPGTGLVVQAGSAAHTINANINLGNSQIWEIDNAPSNPLTVSGVIANGTANDSLFKTGAGTLILNNAETYTGGTYVQAGTLALGAAGSLLTTGTLTVEGAGTFDLGGSNQTLGALSDGGVSTGIITNSGAASNTITLNNSANNTFSGTITDNGANNAASALGLTLNGAGKVTLSGSNSYNGLTTVSGGGILVVANNYALGNSASANGGLVLTSGTVDFISANPNVAGLENVGTTGVGTSIVLGNATSGTATTLTLGAGGALIGGGLNMQYGGVISDRSGTNPAAIGNLVVTGGSILLLSGANTFTGTTSIIGAGSELAIGNSLALQNSTLNTTGGGSVAFFNGITTVTLGGLSGSGNLALTNSSTANVALTFGNAGGTFSGNLSGAGSVVTHGTGTETLLDATYTGSTTLYQGSLTIGGSSDMVGAGNIDLVGAYGTTGGYLNTLTVTGNAIINTTGNITLASNDGQNGNNYPGASTLVVTGTSSVTATNLSIGNNSRVPAGTSVTVAQSGFLAITGTLNLDLTEGGTAAVNNVNLNGGTLAAGNIDFVGGNGAPLGQQGAVNFNGGVLEALASDPVGGYFLADPTFSSTAISTLIDAGGAIINSNGYNITIATPLLHGGGTPDGGLTKNGAGTLYLTAANSYTGVTTVNAGTLNIDGQYALGGSVYGGFNFNGGTLQYNSTVVATGTDGNSDISQTSSGVAEHVTFTSTANIDTNGTPVVYGDTVGNGGAGGLNLTDSLGTGSLTLEGVDTYTGATIINAGATLRLGNGASGEDGTILNTSSITDNGTLVYNRFGALSSAVAINGTGTVVKIGSGSQTLSASNGYTGATIISAGALIVTGSLTSTASVSVSNGGTLSLQAANALNSAAPLTLATGTLQTLASQTETLSTLTLGAGTSTLSLGATGSIVDFADSSAIAWNGTLSITNWNGASSGGGSDQVFIGTTADLTVGQLADISFFNPTVNGVVDNGTYGAQQLSDGELVLVAIPEPGTWAMLLAGAAMLGVWQQRKRRLGHRG